MERKKLGEILHEQGKTSSEHLQQAIVKQQQKTLRLGELLIQQRLVARDDVSRALDEVLHPPICELLNDPNRTRGLKADPLRRFRAVHRSSNLSRKQIPCCRHGRASESKRNCGASLLFPVAFRNEILEAIRKPGSPHSLT